MHRQVNAGPSTQARVQAFNASVEKGALLLQSMSAQLGDSELDRHLKSAVDTLVQMSTRTDVTREQAVALGSAFSQLSDKMGWLDEVGRAGATIKVAESTMALMAQRTNATTQALNASSTAAQAMASTTGQTAANIERAVKATEQLKTSQQTARYIGRQHNRWRLDE